MHWPLIDYECGPIEGADTFIEWWFKADRGELEPFVLVIEGSIPNEALKEEGYWCGFGNDPATGQPITTSEWLDRLAPKGDGDPRGRHVRDLWRHPCHGRQSHRRDGGRRLPRLGLAIEAGLPIVSPVARCIPTTSRRRSSTCCTRSPAPTR